MSLLDKLAEQKISEAISRGELDDLPGMGKPLELDDDAMVPHELRAGFRLLKNAGYLPPGMELRKEIESVESLIIQAKAQEEKQALSRRLQYLLVQLNLSCPGSSLITEQYYFEKLANRKELE